MMKFLTLYQPWASLIACGAKQIETRSWATSYRGWLGICAAKMFPLPARFLCGREPFTGTLIRAGYGDPRDLPLGAVLVIVNLTCILTVTRALLANLSEEERAFGNYALGRRAWCSADTVRLPRPILCRGRQGLWSDEELAERVQLALGRKFP